MMEFVSWDDYSQYDGKVIIQPCSSHHQAVLNHQPHQSSSTIINPNHQSGNSKIEGENPIFDHNPIPILRNWRGFAAWKPPQNWIIFDEPNAILGFSPLILCGQTPCSFMEHPAFLILHGESLIFHTFRWFDPPFFMVIHGSSGIFPWKTPAIFMAEDLHLPPPPCASSAERLRSRTRRRCHLEEGWK